jgi:hypothetical protein
MVLWLLPMPESPFDMRTRHGRSLVMDTFEHGGLGTFILILFFVASLFRFVEFWIDLSHATPSLRGFPSPLLRLCQP